VKLGMEIQAALPQICRAGFLALTASVWLWRSIAPTLADGLTEAKSAYEHGNYETAFGVLTPMADSGVPEAQYYLGLLYREGRGTPQDFQRAVELFQRASDQNAANATTALGIMYEVGSGVAKDLSAAAQLFKKAADQDFGPAQAFLGAMAATGEGIPRDVNQAVILFRRAADNGVPMAQYILGRYYERGFGVADDKAAALQWFEICSQHADDKEPSFDGFDKQDDLFRDLARRDSLVLSQLLPRDQVSSAKNRAAIWKANRRINQQ